VQRDALLGAMERDPDVFAPLDAQLDGADHESRVPQLHVAESGAIGLAEA
jgi:hypothetical protein